MAESEGLEPSEVCQHPYGFKDRCNRRSANSPIYKYKGPDLYREPLEQSRGSLHFRGSVIISTVGVKHSVGLAIVLGMFTYRVSTRLRNYLVRNKLLHLHGVFHQV